MFGDNQAVVDNSAVPHSCLSKRHNALSYHRVREAIAVKVISYFWIDGKNNPADIVSKHWLMHKFGICFSQFCFSLVIQVFS